MHQRVARASEPLQTAWLAVLGVLMTARYLWVFAHHPLAPGNDLPARAWFGWADQAAYFLAAHGWASGNLDPSQHLYPAGYGLLGAVFVPVTPGEPFVIPNLLCWLASLWLFAALGARLAPGIPAARAVAATVFFLAEVADLHALYTWEVPWTSTPAATLTFGGLLLAVRYGEEGRPWQAPAAALLSGLVVLFRPTDALIIMPTVGLCLLGRIWADRAGWRPAAVTLAMAGAGFAAGPLLLVATHVATHGWVLGRYFVNSSLVGFEWRLLPLRWVTLLLSPRPLYPMGRGFAEIYWFVLPGLAGIFTAIAADRGRRRWHLAVGGAAIVFLCFYLCYRDLHVPGLFDFSNQHYFKWTVPVFALYALMLPYLLLVRRRVLAGVAAIAAVVLLSCWRAQLVLRPAEPAGTVLAGGAGLALPRGLGRIDDAVLAAAPEDFLSQYFGAHVLEADGRRFTAGVDFKVMPVPFGFMVFPLRPLPAAPSELWLADPVRLAPAAAVVVARQAIVFGVPCLLARRRAACRYRPIPALS